MASQNGLMLERLKNIFIRGGKTLEWYVEEVGDVVPHHGFVPPGNYGLG